MGRRKANTSSTGPTAVTALALQCQALGLGGADARPATQTPGKIAARATEHHALRTTVLALLRKLSGIASPKERTQWVLDCLSAGLLSHVSQILLRYDRLITVEPVGDSGANGQELRHMPGCPAQNGAADKKRESTAGSSPNWGRSIAACCGHCLAYDAFQTMPLGLTGRPALPGVAASVDAAQPLPEDALCTWALTVRLLYTLARSLKENQASLFALYQSQWTSQVDTRELSEALLRAIRDVADVTLVDGCVIAAVQDAMDAVAHFGAAGLALENAILVPGILDWMNELLESASESGKEHPGSYGITLVRTSFISAAQWCQRSSKFQPLDLPECVQMVALALRLATLRGVEDITRWTVAQECLTAVLRAARGLAGRSDVKGKLRELTVALMRQCFTSKKVQTLGDALLTALVEPEDVDEALAVLKNSVREPSHTVELNAAGWSSAATERALDTLDAAAQSRNGCGDLSQKHTVTLLLACVQNLLQCISCIGESAGEAKPKQLLLAALDRILKILGYLIVTDAQARRDFRLEGGLEVITTLLEGLGPQKDLERHPGILEGLCTIGAALCGATDGPKDGKLREAIIKAEWIPKVVRCLSLIPLGIERLQLRFAGFLMAITETLEIDHQFMRIGFTEVRLKELYGLYVASAKAAAGPLEHWNNPGHLANCLLVCSRVAIAHPDPWALEKGTVSVIFFALDALRRFPGNSRVSASACQALSVFSKSSHTTRPGSTLPERDKLQRCTDVVMDILRTKCTSDLKASRRHLLHLLDMGLVDKTHIDSLLTKLKTHSVANMNESCLISFHQLLCELQIYAEAPGLWKWHSMHSTLEQACNSLRSAVEAFVKQRPCLSTEVQRGLQKDLQQLLKIILGVVDAAVQSFRERDATSSRRNAPKSASLIQALGPALLQLGSTWLSSFQAETHTAERKSQNASIASILTASKRVLECQKGSLGHAYRESMANSLVGMLERDLGNVSPSLRDSLLGCVKSAVAQGILIPDRMGSRLLSRLQAMLSGDLKGQNQPSCTIPGTIEVLLRVAEAAKQDKEWLALMREDGNGLEWCLTRLLETEGSRLPASVRKSIEWLARFVCLSETEVEIEYIVKAALARIANVIETSDAKGIDRAIKGLADLLLTYRRVPESVAFASCLDADRILCDAVAFFGVGRKRLAYFDTNPVTGQFLFGALCYLDILRRHYDKREEDSSENLSQLMSMQHVTFLTTVFYSNIDKFCISDAEVLSRSEVLLIWVEFLSWLVKRNPALSRTLSCKGAIEDLITVVIDTPNWRDPAQPHLEEGVKLLGLLMQFPWKAIHFNESFRQLCAQSIVKPLSSLPDLRHQRWKPHIVRALKMFVALTEQPTREEVVRDSSRLVYQKAVLTNIVEALGLCSHLVEIVRTYQAAKASIPGQREDLETQQNLYMIDTILRNLLDVWSLGPGSSLGLSQEVDAKAKKKLWGDLQSSPQEGLSSVVPLLHRGEEDSLALPDSKKLFETMVSTWDTVHSSVGDEVNALNPDALKSISAIDVPRLDPKDTERVDETTSAAGALALIQQALAETSTPLQSEGEGIQTQKALRLLLNAFSVAINEPTPSSMVADCSKDVLGCLLVARYARETLQVSEANSKAQEAAKKVLSVITSRLQNATTRIGSVHIPEKHQERLGSNGVGEASDAYYKEIPKDLAQTALDEFTAWMHCYAEVSPQVALTSTQNVPREVQSFLETLRLNVLEPFEGLRSSPLGTTPSALTQARKACPQATSEAFRITAEPQIVRDSLSAEKSTELRDSNSQVLQKLEATTQSNKRKENDLISTEIENTNSLNPGCRDSYEASQTLNCSSVATELPSCAAGANATNEAQPQFCSSSDEAYGCTKRHPPRWNLESHVRPWGPQPSAGRSPSPLTAQKNMYGGAGDERSVWMSRDQKKSPIVLIQWKGSAESILANVVPERLYGSSKQAALVGTDGWRSTVAGGSHVLRETSSSNPFNVANGVEENPEAPSGECDPALLNLAPDVLDRYLLTQILLREARRRKSFAWQFPESEYSEPAKLLEEDDKLSTSEESVPMSWNPLTDGHIVDESDNAATPGSELDQDETILFTSGRVRRMRRSKQTEEEAGLFLVRDVYFCPRVEHRFQSSWARGSRFPKVPDPDSGDCASDHKGRNAQRLYPPLPCGDTDTDGVAFVHHKQLTTDLKDAQSTLKRTPFPERTERLSVDAYGGEMTEGMLPTLLDTYRSLPVFRRAASWSEISSYVTEASTYETKQCEVPCGTSRRHHAVCPPSEAPDAVEVNPTSREAPPLPFRTLKLLRAVQRARQEIAPLSARSGGCKSNLPHQVYATLISLVIQTEACLRLGDLNVLRDTQAIPTLARVASVFLSEQDMPCRRDIERILSRHAALTLDGAFAYNAHLGSDQAKGIREAEETANGMASRRQGVLEERRLRASSEDITTRRRFLSEESLGLQRQAPVWLQPLQDLPRLTPTEVMSDLNSAATVRKRRSYAPDSGPSHSAHTKHIACPLTTDILTLQKVYTVWNEEFSAKGVLKDIMINRYLQFVFDTMFEYAATRYDDAESQKAGELVYGCKCLELLHTRQDRMSEWCDTYSEGLLLFSSLFIQRHNTLVDAVIRALISGFLCWLEGDATGSLIPKDEQLSDYLRASQSVRISDVVVAHLQEVTSRFITSRCSDALEPALIQRLRLTELVAYHNHHEISGKKQPRRYFCGTQVEQGLLRLWKLGMQGAIKGSTVIHALRCMRALIVPEWLTPLSETTIVSAFVKNLFWRSRHLYPLEKRLNHWACFDNAFPPFNDPLRKDTCTEAMRLEFLKHSLFFIGYLASIVRVRKALGEAGVVEQILQILYQAYKVTQNQGKKTGLNQDVVVPFSGYLLHSESGSTKTGGLPRAWSLFHSTRSSSSTVLDLPDVNDRPGGQPLHLCYYAEARKCQINACLALANLVMEDDANALRFSSSGRLPLNVALLNTVRSHTAAHWIQDGTGCSNFDVANGASTLMCNACHKRPKIQKLYAELGVCQTVIQILTMSWSAAVNEQSDSAKRCLYAVLAGIGNLAMCPTNIPLLVDNGLSQVFPTFFSQPIEPELLRQALRSLSNIVMEVNIEAMSSFSPCVPHLVQILQESDAWVVVPSTSGNEVFETRVAIFLLIFDILASLCRLPENAATFHRLNGPTIVFGCIERYNNSSNEREAIELLDYGFRLLIRQGTLLPESVFVLERNGFFKYVMDVCEDEFIPRKTLIKSLRLILISVMLSLRPAHESVVNPSGILRLTTKMMVPYVPRRSHAIDTENAPLQEKCSQIPRSHDITVMTYVCWILAALTAKQELQPEESTEWYRSVSGIPDKTSFRSVMSFSGISENDNKYDNDSQVTHDPSDLDTQFTQTLDVDSTNEPETQKELNSSFKSLPDSHYAEAGSSNRHSDALNSGAFYPEKPNKSDVSNNEVSKDAGQEDVPSEQRANECLQNDGARRFLTQKTVCWDGISESESPSPSKCLSFFQTSKFSWSHSRGFSRQASRRILQNEAPSLWSSLVSPETHTALIEFGNRLLGSQISTMKFLQDEKTSTNDIHTSSRVTQNSKCPQNTPAYPNTPRECIDNKGHEAHTDINFPESDLELQESASDSTTPKKKAKKSLFRKSEPKSGHVSTTSVFSEFLVASAGIMASYCTSDVALMPNFESQNKQNLMEDDAEKEKKSQQSTPRTVENKEEKECEEQQQREESLPTLSIPRFILYLELLFDTVHQQYLSPAEAVDLTRLGAFSFFSLLLHGASTPVTAPRAADFLQNVRKSRLHPLLIQVVRWLDTELQKLQRKKKKWSPFSSFRSLAHPFRKKDAPSNNKEVETEETKNLCLQEASSQTNRLNSRQLSRAPTTLSEDVRRSFSQSIPPISEKSFSVFSEDTRYGSEYSTASDMGAHPEEFQNEHCSKDFAYAVRQAEDLCLLALDVLDSTEIETLCKALSESDENTERQDAASVFSHDSYHPEATLTSCKHFNSSASRRPFCLPDLFIEATARNFFSIARNLNPLALTRCRLDSCVNGVHDLPLNVKARLRTGGVFKILEQKPPKDPEKPDTPPLFITRLYEWCASSDLLRLEWRQMTAKGPMDLNTLYITSVTRIQPGHRGARFVAMINSPQGKQLTTKPNRCCTINLCPVKTATRPQVSELPLFFKTSPRCSRFMEDIYLWRTAASSGMD